MDGTCTDNDARDVNGFYGDVSAGKHEGSGVEAWSMDAQDPY